MCGDLEALSRQFIYQNFLEVMLCEEFLHLSEERLVLLLKSDKLQVKLQFVIYYRLITV